MDQLEALDVVREHLKDYLESHGVEVTSNGMFKCINPDHDDNNPSCGIVPSTPEVFHCFSCGFNGNIFTAAHVLEGLPREGETFWSITLPKLTSYYGIAYDKVEMTEEQKRRAAMYAAYSDAAAVICNQRNNTRLEEYLKDRGWSLDTAKKLCIGAIPSVEAYEQKMNALGWSSGYLRRINLLDPSIMNERNLIFIIRDHSGNPVAFSARNMEWKSKAESGEKYHNSPNSDIYTKSHILYNLSNARKLIGPMVITEGYADVAALVNVDPTIRAVATCGVQLYPEQVAAMRKQNVLNVELFFDGDKAGFEAVNKIVESFTQESHGINIKIIETPKDKDPGDIPQMYRDLTRYAPFEWALKNASEQPGYDPDQTVASAIPSLLLIEDRVERFTRMRQLSKMTDVPIRVIQDEVERRSNQEDFRKKERETAIRNDLIKKLSDDRIAVSDAIATGTRLIQSLEEEFMDEDSITEERYAEQIREIWSTIESGEATKGRLSIPAMQKTESWLDGFPTTAAMILVGGIPHAGKTSWLRYLGWNLATANKDVTVIYHNVDEPIQRMIPSLVSIDSGIELYKVRHMNDQDSRTVERLRKSWNNVEGLGLSGNFIVKDQGAGATLDSIEYMIRHYQDKYPDRKLVYIFDNFHKLQDYPGTDMRTKYVACSTRAKNLSVKYDIPIIMTVELRKIDTRSKGRGHSKPRMEDIKETGSLAYDCDTIIMVHNELQVNPETNHFWYRHSGQGDVYSGTNVPHERKQPVIDLIWEKNRETGKKGTIHFKFDPGRNYFEEKPGMLLAAEESVGADEKGATNPSQVSLPY